MRKKLRIAEALAAMTVIALSGIYYLVPSFRNDIKGFITEGKAATLSDSLSEGLEISAAGIDVGNSIFDVSEVSEVSDSSDDLELYDVQVILESSETTEDYVISDYDRISEEYRRTPVESEVEIAASMGTWVPAPIYEDGYVDSYISVSDVKFGSAAGFRAKALGLKNVEEAGKQLCYIEYEVVFPEDYEAGDTYIPFLLYYWESKSGNFLNYHVNTWNGINGIITKAEEGNTGTNYIFYNIPQNAVDVSLYVSPKMVREAGYSIALNTGAEYDITDICDIDAYSTALDLWQEEKAVGGDMFYTIKSLFGDEAYEVAENFNILPDCSSKNEQYCLVIYAGEDAANINAGSSANGAFARAQREKSRIIKCCEEYNIYITVCIVKKSASVLHLV